MEIRTYRARTLEQALAYVHQEMGPEARIVHARELETSWWERVSKGRQFEIRTGEQANNPLSLRRCGANDLADPVRTQVPFESEVDDLAEFRQRFRQPPFSSESHRSTDLFAEGSLNPRPAHHGLSIELPNRNEMTYAPVVFELLTRLIEADVSPVAARELVDIVRSASVDNAQWTLHQWQQALLQQLLSELPRGGAIRVTPDRRKTIALVGPTGVGKTTTIAKLAANWRLHDHCRIGLVTVDTYRVAAVEQLRTYAEIMDLPMEVVTTPREMRAAVARFADQDLILIDTAGRSPHDALQLQELRSLLGEANADEVQLVLSGVSSASHIQQTVHRFMEVGTTGLVVTKLDETTSLGNLLATLREVRLPVSYLTCGQNVPDDIVPADPQRFVPSLLGFKPLDSAV